MRNRIMAGFLLLVISTAALAQDREAIFEQFLQFGSLVKGGSIQPNWLADGSGFWYAENGPANTAVWKVDPASDSREPMFDVPRLRAALAKTLGYEPPHQGVPFEQFTLSPDGSAVTFALEGQSLMLNLQTYAVTRLPPPDPAAQASQARFTPKSFPRRGYFGVNPVGESLSPDGRWFATLQDDDIVLRSTADGRHRQLTHNGNADNAWDIESIRLRLNAGMNITMIPFSSWSPNSLKLWATQIDRSALAHKYEMHYLKTEDEVQPRPFAIAGGQLDHVVPHIVDILSGEAIPLDLDETRNYYFNFLGWQPDGSEALFARFSRDFKTVDVMAGNAHTGKVRKLFSESAETFVKIQHAVIAFGNTGFTAIAGGKQFLWESTRDGWNHLYLYSTDGKLVRQLTEGEMTVLDVISVDTAKGWVYFTAHDSTAPGGKSSGQAPRAYDIHLYRVRLDGGRSERLTEAEGLHSAALSPSFDYFIDTWSKTDHAPQVDLRSTDGTFIRTLAQADISALKTLGWTPTEEFVVKAADGKTDLWGVMHKPYDFDPNKKYPVIEYLYAGPQIVTADHSFSISPGKTGNLPRAMAQLGYIVVTLDARGTPERSKAFQDVVYRAWGRNEIPDHAGAIRELGKRHAFMDLNRVGIWGHSWGGYFTFRGMADAPELYRAGIASAPGFDPYSSLLYEPYLDLPDRAKEAYDFASPFRLAPNIKGKLMLAVGSNDFATMPEVMKMSRALIDAGVHHEQVVLPAEGHGYSGKAEEYFIETVAEFFGRHLKP